MSPAIDFSWAAPDGVPERHHAEAAAANVSVVDGALEALEAALRGDASTERVLLRAAAGAGKSYALARLVATVLQDGAAERVAVTAFTNKQVQPLARKLGGELGKDAVVLLAAKNVDVPEDVVAAATVVRSISELPDSARVVVGTASRLGVFQEPRRLLDHLGPTTSDKKRAFDVLFVDEAWQMAEHLFGGVRGLARVVVGVGDVGQLPPLDPGQNPWRGDPGYNPYRAWPTSFAGDAATYAVDLPTVWRPTAAQIHLWRAFYPDWAELYCVAAPDDRALETPLVTEPAASLWTQVGTGLPTLLEVTGLADPDSADVDLPLMTAVESLLDQLLISGFRLRHRTYHASGAPDGTRYQDHSSGNGDPLIAVLATRNQAVDDAHAVVERLIERHGLPDGVIVASTVDSWQGQTNGITIAVHPLSGADRLDDFNSAFGRLAVACTRATHGLLLVARDGIDALLADAPARPGTPFGEPGPRSLPRQTHRRIVDAMARGTVDAADLASAPAQPTRGVGAP